MIHSPIQSVNIVFYGKSRKVNFLHQTHIRNYYNHTHLDQAYKGEVWLSILDATECSFFATFWTSWSNLTLTSTLLTNYCKHSIHSVKSASERYFSLILQTSLSLSLELARKQVYMPHIHQHPILIFYFFFEVP